jgi:hypothetical protein
MGAIGKGIRGTETGISDRMSHPGYAGVNTA